MTTHVLKATFPDGETLEHAFAVGDVIVIGYYADPYKRTAPLMEGGVQLASVEIRTSDPRTPLPTFEVTKKPSSILPIALDCADHCQRIDCADVLAVEIADTLRAVGFDNRDLYYSVQRCLDKYLNARTGAPVATRESVKRHPAQVECLRLLDEIKAIAPPQLTIEGPFGPWGCTVVADALDSLPAEAWSDSAHLFWLDDIATTKARQVLWTLKYSLRIVEGNEDGSTVDADVG